MAEMWAKKHPVISGVVIAVLGSMVFKEPRALVSISLSWIWMIIIKGYHWLISDVNIPCWLLIMISILAIIAITQIAYGLCKNGKSPDFYEYREDYLSGIKWRWGWHNRQINDLRGYCPNCDYQLTYIKSDMWSDENKTSFYCDRCSSVVSEIKGGGLDYALGVIRREIDRKVRNQLYPKSETH